MANLATAQAAIPASANLAQRDVTPGLGHAVRLRPSDPNRIMHVAVALKLRNAASLQAFIARVSDPGSRARGRYLTPAQFSALYSPTASDAEQVASHLRHSGLSVTAVSANRTIIDVFGPVRAVQQAFGVTISDWHDRDQNRDFFGNDAQPVLPASLAPLVVSVAGLNNHYPRRHATRQPMGLATAAGPAGGYTPSDLRSAYDVTPLIGTTVPGSGQSLGLFELDSFNQANITMYDTHYTLLTVPPKPVTVDTGPTPNGGEPEVELDIEVMHALAPSAPITVWEGPNTDDGALDTYNAMVTSDTTPSNSTSWGICEPNTTAAEMTALDNVFQQAAAQGQSFFAASGDDGAFDCAGATINPSGGLAVDNPADDPYVTGVGGTALTLSGSGGYGSEAAWSDRSRTPNVGSGGGLSTMFARPAWQTGPGVQNADSNGMRQVPDVALDADPRTGYSVYVTDSGGAGWRMYGGTSASAPAWAAVTSLANTYANSQGFPNLGFANPRLYRLNTNQPPYPAFHDVISGNNLYYAATAGWDFATGWGSVDAYNLAQDLAATAGPPRVVPHGLPASSPRVPGVVPQSTPIPQPLLGLPPKPGGTFTQKIRARLD
ncbi:MAG: peptidase S8 [Chloroflexi bacterium]|nr:MAG: peptidase S8 [Chloroflexota bacterium]